jgi:hypothetical protein
MEAVPMLLNRLRGGVLALGKGRLLGSRTFTVRISVNSPNWGRETDAETEMSRSSDIGEMDKMDEMDEMVPLVRFLLLPTHYQ